MHPNEPVEDISEYKCDQCEEVFSAKSLLVSHVKSEHSPSTNMYQCTSCPSQFTNKVILSLRRQFNNVVCVTFIEVTVKTCVATQETGVQAS